MDLILVIKYFVDNGSILLLCVSYCLQCWPPSSKNDDIINVPLLHTIGLSYI